MTAPLAGPVTAGDHLPHDPDAERAVLGAVLLDPDVLSLIIEKLQAGDFYLEINRNVYQACLDLHEKGVAVDLVTVRNHLDEQGELERVGSSSYLSSLVDAVPDVANVASYVQIVCDKRRERKQRWLGQRLINGEDPKKIQAEFQQIIDSAGASDDVAWRTLRDYAEHPELLQPLDEVLPSLAWRGRVAVLAAREKLGKSTLLAFFASVLSRSSECHSILWVGLEESRFDVVSRFLEFGADSDRVVIAERLPIRFQDLDAAIADHKPDLVVIDSLAAWGAGRVTDWNAAAQVTPVMLELVDLARRHNVALVILHHGKKSAGDGRIQGQFSVPQLAQKILPNVGDGFQFGKSDKPASPLDGMNGAKNTA